MKYFATYVLQAALLFLFGSGVLAIHDGRVLLGCALCLSQGVLAYWRDKIMGAAAEEEIAALKSEVEWLRRRRSAGL